MHVPEAPGIYGIFADGCQMQYSVVEPVILGHEIPEAVRIGDGLWINARDGQFFEGAIAEVGEG